MNNPSDILQFFEDRITSLQKRTLLFEKKVQRLSWIRVLLFQVFALLVIYFANAREIQAMVLSGLAFVPLFGWTVRLHNKAKFALNQHQYLLSINQNEIKRIDGNFAGIADGAEFFDQQHAYAPDLDIFGSNSLFQLLVRSQLPGTKRLMSQWLLQHSSKSEILDRQEAVSELVTKTEWRQNLTANGHHGDQQNEKYSNVVLSLIQWIDDNLKGLNNPFWSILRFAMPLISIVILSGIGIADWPYQWIYWPVIINLVLLSFIYKPLMQITKEFGNIAEFLKGYENVILGIEQQSFSSSLLRKLHGRLKANDGSASSSIRKLRRILMFLLSRVNLLYMPFNVLFLLDVNWLLMANQWKKKNILQVEHWFDAVHHIDALNDLASFAFSNPTYCWPDVSDKNHFLHSSTMAHPLIKSAQRVSNDFELSSKGKLGLVTGSNMSGKSTFLRTVGVNLVLAQMGAPVCAEKFEISLVQIFTSMRTQDNLEENVSSFYAELKRLKSLLDLLKSKEPVFYMLDEILKGTNSDDRHKGALSLIDQLVDENCRGLISTHDIQLSTHSKDQTNIQNMSFNSIIQGDEILFDYKLSLAPCTSFNASKLMEKMGIIKK